MVIVVQYKHFEQCYNTEFFIDFCLYESTNHHRKTSTITFSGLRPAPHCMKIRAPCIAAFGMFGH